MELSHDERSEHLMYARIFQLPYNCLKLASELHPRSPAAPLIKAGETTEQKVKQERAEQARKDDKERTQRREEA